MPSKKLLEGMSPSQKWVEAIQRIGLPDIPTLTPSMRRLFLRQAPNTRIITDKGVCYFGMHYNSDTLGTISQIDKEDQKIEFSIRYDPADISTITIWDEDVYIDDLEAKELRLPDGSLKRTSEWEVKMAKALAKKNDGCKEDWLSYLNDAEELEKKRKAERERIRRQRKRLAQEEQGEDEHSKIEENVEDISLHDDEYLTNLLADFKDEAKRPFIRKRDLYYDRT